MKRTMTGRGGGANPDGTKSKPVIITDDVYELLMDITHPAGISHNSSHADMIRNVVLEEVRGRIQHAYNKNSLRA